MASSTQHSVLAIAYWPQVNVVEDCTSICLRCFRTSRLAMHRDASRCIASGCATVIARPQNNRKRKYTITTAHTNVQNNTHTQTTTHTDTQTHTHLQTDTHNTHNTHNTQYTKHTQHTTHTTHRTHTSHTTHTQHTQQTHTTQTHHTEHTKHNAIDQFTPKAYDSGSYVKCSAFRFTV